MSVELLNIESTNYTLEVNGTVPALEVNAGTTLEVILSEMGLQGPPGPAGPVQSVAGKIGAVTLTKADVGLSNVDNTSDANKPVSTAHAAAIATATAIHPFLLIGA